MVVITQSELVGNLTEGFRDHGTQLEINAKDNSKGLLMNSKFVLETEDNAKCVMANAKEIILKSAL